MKNEEGHMLIAVVPGTDRVQFFDEDYRWVDGAIVTERKRKVYTTASVAQATAEITKLFAQLRAQEKIDRLAMLIMGPDEAAHLFIEGGLLTIDMIEDSVEGDDYLDIPGLMVGGLTLVVRIKTDFKDGLVAADAYGNPI